MPKLVDHEQQRQRILKAAVEVFAARGLEGTGLTHVARAVGLSRPALYTYYADKQSLVRDLAGYLMERELALFRSLLARPGSAAARIDALNAGLETLVREESAGGAVMLQLWLTRPKPLRDGLQALAGMLAPVISEGQRDGAVKSVLPAEDLAWGLIGLWDGFLLQACLFPDRLPNMPGLARALLGFSC